tara:strand:+ start:3022 stop:4395 length:1374 start_codon:yes stop_codon:yes gene_type:complete
MGAGSIQLAAIGPQDFHLTANPQITFFKSVYKRHTNFSKEVKRIFFNGAQVPNFGLKDVRANIQKEGDLLGNVFLELNVKGTGVNTDALLTRTVANFSNSLVDKIRCEIGGYTIDTHYGRFYQILDEIEGNANEDNQLQSNSNTGGKYISIDRTDDTSQNIEVINSYNRLKGNYTLCYKGSQNSNSTGHNTEYIKRFYYPLKFWFNKNPGQYLPIVSLFKHKVSLLFDFAEKNKVIGNSTNISNFSMAVKLFGEFYFLDKSEKTRFAQSNHEYIIEQVQLNAKDRIITPIVSGADTVTSLTDYELYFNHPVKYITWVIVNEGTAGSNQGQGPCYFVSLTNSSAYGDDGNNGTVELFLEGVTREIEMPMIYYTRYLPSKLLKAVPVLDRIGFYSFALNPLDPEPSGTCNFSKLYNKNMKMVFGNMHGSSALSQKDLYIYAVNYNVLTITNGMAAVRYA